MNKIRPKSWGVLFCIYLVLINAIAFVALTKTDLIEKAMIKTGLKAKPVKSEGFAYYLGMAAEAIEYRSLTLKRNDPQMVFIADSMVDRLCVESIFRAVNFSISGDTVKNVKERIKLYRNLDGKFIILALGINDIPRPTKMIVDDYRSILDTLDPIGKVMISSVLPVDEARYFSHAKISKSNSQIKELNEELKGLSGHYKNVYFEYTSAYLMDPQGVLRHDLHIGDGLHLNPKGYARWVEGLKEAIDRVSRRDTAIGAIVKGVGP